MKWTTRQKCSLSKIVSQGISEFEKVLGNPQGQVLLPLSFCFLFLILFCPFQNLADFYAGLQKKKKLI